MPKTSRWMIAYGLFLIVGALVAISISGWDRSKTALFSSSGAAMLMFGCAFLAARPKPQLASLGTWGGIALSLMFGATFLWRLNLNQAKPTAAEWLAQNPGLVEAPTRFVESPLQNWLFPVFIGGSLLTFCSLVFLRRLSA